MVKWVDIISFNAIVWHGTVIARCIFENDIVHCNGEELVLHFLEKGIPQEGGSRIMPKDGEAFLYAVSEHFQNAYVFATAVQEAGAIQDFMISPPKVLLETE